VRKREHGKTGNKGKLPTVPTITTVLTPVTALVPVATVDENVASESELKTAEDPVLSSRGFIFFCKVSHGVIWIRPFANVYT
jgi:hypothetical protein